MAVDIFGPLFEVDPTFRVQLVKAPGWYGDAYLTRAYTVGRGDGSIEFMADPASEDNGHRIGDGDLASWQEILPVAEKSSAMVLALGAVFAATLLKGLGLDSFGINIHGETSTGKTSALWLASAAAGLTGSEEMLTFADTEIAMFEAAVDHRDGILLIDETADGGYTDAEIGLRVKALAYGLSRNRQKRRARSFENSNPTIKAEFRVIALITSERALADFAPIEPGQTVRIIDLPTGDTASYGVFDGDLSEQKHPGRWARKGVRKIRKQCHEGHALKKFLECFVADEKGWARARNHLRRFEADFQDHITRHQRIAACFGAIYAGLRLAASYGVLPWSKEFIREQIVFCATAAIRAVAVDQTRPKQSRVNEDAFISAVMKLQIYPMKERSRPTQQQAQRRINADALIVGNNLLIKPGRLPKSIGLPAWAKRSGPLKISGLSSRHRCTVVNLKKAPRGFRAFLRPNRRSKSLTGH